MTDKERLEQVKEILRSPGEVFFGSISEDGVVSQDVADAEPYFDWLIERAQELERELELCDSAMHIIDMTINNPSTSDDDKWKKVNKTMRKYYADDCIHCNGKGFNGLDYCPHCIRGEILQENIELEQQNKRYREALEFYADRKTYSEKVSDEWGSATPILQDRGYKARKELEESE